MIFNGRQHLTEIRKKFALPIPHKHSLENDFF